MASRAKRRVGIFWDVENCSVPAKIPARIVAARIKTVIKNFGEIVTFNVYGDSRYSGLLDKQEELREAGVCVIVTPHKSKPQVADMRIIADIIAFALGNATPVTVILISSDGDFAHAVSIIQEKGHAVWIISNTKASAKLVGIADGRMSWNYDVLERAYEIPRNSEAPQLPDEDVQVLEDSQVVNLCSNVEQMATGLGFAYPILPRLSSSSSFYASTITRTAPVQTFSLPSGEIGYSASYSPLSIITSTPCLNTYGNLRRALPAPAPAPAPPWPAATVPVPAPAPALGPAPRVRSSSPVPSTKRVTAPTRFHSKLEFNPLITLLRQLRATDPQGTRKLRCPEVATMLRRRDPSIFRQYKKPRLYLKKAVNAGILLMFQEEGHAPVVSLHPDYY
ncbi:hypothetical protein ACEPAI_9112 [Sanghuangporus weigelae]